MKTLMILIERNTKIFFKDKGTFLSAMISPLILIVLYIFFLGNIFESSFESALPQGLTIDKSFINAYVGGWEISSILAVCSVTVALVANMVIVDDKINGAIKDLTIAPVKSSTLALSYYISTALITLIVCVVAIVIGFIYLAIVGWHLNAAYVAYIFLDTLLMCLFGTALSSLICHFIKSQGAMTAVSVIVSSVYGFVCGAYYPISQMAKGIQNFAVCLPGTYGTSLFRYHYLNNVLLSLKSEYNFPNEAIEGMKDAFDINLYFFDNKVSVGVMYAVVAVSTVVILGIFILLNYLRSRKRKL